jgi:two-component system OmpR family response regulator
MTTACLCEVERPGLVTVLRGRGVAVQQVRRSSLPDCRPPAGSVLVATLPAGDRHIVDLRRAWRGALLLMVAGLGAGQAAVAAALDAGADDAVTERAEDMLIAARIAALARRANAVVDAGPLRIDRVARSVSRSGRPLDLLPREYAILSHLLDSHGAVVTRAELRRTVWQREFDSGTNVIEVHVSRLRRKLDAAGEVPLLLTERGRGYRLAVP